MKRYIRSSRKDDLLKQKAEWQMKFDARNQVYKDQERNYHNARWDWIDNLTSLVTKQFQSYIDKLPGLVITADRSWGDVEIRFNYEDHGRDDRERKSLLWDYYVKLNEKGEIKKESNSWSGFQAVTSAQIDDLMNSANLLKAIVNFDWAPLLEKAQQEMPKSKNYIGITDPHYDPDYKDPGYDKMIREAEIEDALESGKWIKGTSNYGSATWFYIVSQTPKFYNIVTVREGDIRRTAPDSPYYEELANRIRDPKNASPYWIERVKKDNIGFARPIETKTSDELLQLAGVAAQ